MTLRLTTLVLLAATAFAQPAFEVATIKSTPETSPPASIRSFPGGRFETINYTLRMLVQWAWDLDDSRLIGAPKWFDNDRFDIVAKSPDGKPPRGQYQRMMQSLLKERFKLIFHNETRELTTYLLVVVITTPKFNSRRCVWISFSSNDPSIRA